MRSIRTLILAGVCSLAACAYHHRVVAPYPATLPPDQRLEVWEGHSSLVLTHVTFDSLAVSGRKGPWRPACGSCRVSIPLVQVDSLRLVNSDIGWAIGGTVALVALSVLNHCWPYAGCY